MQRQLQVNITLQIYTKNINMNLDEESGGDNQYALPFPSLGLVSKKVGARAQQPKRSLCL